ncbi:MAG: Sua5/YciO/YrdC/YwlC family protein, partial [Lachnospiraceae bacterium]|nr:Sua5/YciO/YrdC/YwlC family protein [Lachnospiraceae bacterium]
MVTKSYRVTGIVQGVGFRPFIHRIAETNNLNGWVLNDSKGVLIEVQGKENDIKSFLRDIKNKKPIVSKIDDVFEVDITLSGGKYNSFEIRESVQLDENNTLISPDLCVCDECIKEMFDSHSHRYRYAFINCTNCGPRFTIIKEMPYDRRNTTMDVFEMCKQCSEEYSDVRNRRYHAQPNACPECGPKLNIIDSNGVQVQCDDEVEFIIDKLLEGKICAIKSLGGFHLAVNAKDDNSVKRLRKLKKRDFKPFALMMPSIEVVKRYMHVNEEEEILLKSEKRPIVLLKKKEEAKLPLSIAPKNPCFGVMLPSAPLHYLL